MKGLDFLFAESKKLQERREGLQLELANPGDANQVESATEQIAAIQQRMSSIEGLLPTPTRSKLLEILLSDTALSIERDSSQDLVSAVRQIAHCREGSTLLLSAYASLKDESRIVLLGALDLSDVSSRSVALQAVNDDQKPSLQRAATKVILCNVGSAPVDEIASTILNQAQKPKLVYALSILKNVASIRRVKSESLERALSSIAASNSDPQVIDLANSALEYLQGSGN